MSVLLARKFDVAKHALDSCGMPMRWLASEKLDGMRAYWNGQELVTRNENRISAPEWFTADLPSDQHLDGELFIGRGCFQQTISVCRKKEPVDSEWKQITYKVFDIPSSTQPFRLRYHALNDLCKTLPSHVVCVEHRPCETGEVTHLLSRLEALGAEGVMLRDPDSLYERKRSRSLLKVKSFLDADATVIGHEGGTGKHQGRMGALRCVLDDGTEFGIGIGFTDSQRENPPAVGDVVTFSYFELTCGGVPRFPAFLGVRGDSAKEGGIDG